MLRNPKQVLRDKVKSQGHAKTLPYLEFVHAFQCFTLRTESIPWLLILLPNLNEDVGLPVEYETT